jgi:L-ribulokinase
LVPGIQGVVADGILPGLFGYEAGQAAMGDVFAWFESHAMSQAVVQSALAEPRDPLDWLSERAGELPAGSTGLLVLDWWNGNRSILIDPKLSGAILGLTIHTRPEQLLRALMEGVAFGTRAIVDNFVDHGLAVDRIVVTGGVADHNPVFVQILSDVLNRSIDLAATTQACARGAAVLGAAAAERFPSITDAIRHLGAGAARQFSPNRQAAATYDRLYALYLELHDTLGRDPQLLHALRSLAQAR